MKNKITFSLTFCFKGQTFKPCSTLDLDDCMEKKSAIPCLYSILAQESGFDSYSYEYDVLMMAEIEYEQAEGMAVNFLHDGFFDSENFKIAWHQNKLDDHMESIASRCMNIESFDDHQALKKALIEAYHLGRNSDSQHSKHDIDSTHGFF
ncbi:MAG: hypothetical protein R8K22_02340 [Mariprofundaceae bacterium]